MHQALCFWIFQVATVAVTHWPSCHGHPHWRLCLFKKYFCLNCVLRQTPVFHDSMIGGLRVEIIAKEKHEMRAKDADGAPPQSPSWSIFLTIGRTVQDKYPRWRDWVRVMILIRCPASNFGEQQLAPSFVRPAPHIHTIVTTLHRQSCYLVQDLESN